MAMRLLTMMQVSISAARPFPIHPQFKPRRAIAAADGWRPCDSVPLLGKDQDMKSPHALRNLSLAALASLSLGGCYYGDVYGASYADADCSVRYGDSYWSRDPYAYDDGYYGYDCYDGADYRAGFLQIGFDGGWYQQLYYPGYGLVLFDRYGRRHAMSHEYLSYWGGRRAWWKHHGHRGGHRNDWRRGDGRHDGRHDGRRPGRGYGQGAGAAPPPPGVQNGWNNGPAALPTPRERPRSEGWRGRPRNDAVGNAVPPIGNPGNVASPGNDAASPPPPAMRPRRGGANGWTGNGNWSPPPAAAQPPVPYTPPVSYTPPPAAEPVRPARMPRYSPPTIGNSGVTDVPVQPRPAPPQAAPRMPAAPRYVPTESYTPPPPPAVRSEAPSRDHGGPIRED